ncbi:unnamed protein product [Penicillium glandicola]
MTIQLESSAQGRKCEQCGLPGVRVSTSSGSNDAGSRAYYKCVPCNRNLGICPCTTPGARTTMTCLDEKVSRSLSISSETSNPYNPDEGFDEDWEANCSPGFMVSKFKAQGRELLHWA